MPAALLKNIRTSTDWDQTPSEDETGHWIFAAASEAMLYWPQSVIVQGHSMLPAVIPIGTVMYHGRPDQDVPTAPDWLAFDYEHAYFFAEPPKGYVLTFTTKRALRVIFFDGLSAHHGRDTQQVFTYGKVDEEGTAPFDLHEELCEWAKDHNIDGFMRAEMHFEVINCNFASSLELLSTDRALPSEEMIGQLFKSEPTARDDSHLRPAGWVGSLPTDMWSELDMAAKWHDFAPGETRARPVLSKFVTFYDPAVKSLKAGRKGKMRDQHRLIGIEAEEAKMMMEQLEHVVKDGAGWDERSGVSEVDWESILRVVVERYGERLEFLNNTLAVDSDSTIKPFARLRKARQQVLTTLLPYFTLSDAPPSNLANLSSSAALEGKRAWLAPVIQRCAATHTRSLPTHLFTKQETLLYNGVQTVMREICRRMGRMFYTTYDIETIGSTEDGYSAIAESMRVEINELTDWLDWVQVWLKCRPACSSDEYCIPSNGIPGDIPHRGASLHGYQGDRRSPQCFKRPNA
ncbi:hypothetical protein DL93DRAFT_1753976 [Clavulina sp. PMI_390]|nr:hypothetical protein DL93DRAFT_1753976 [Clavulina sp. PMI_390]